MRRNWRKRAASAVLAVAMVISQLSMWNIATDIVFAADTDWVTTGLVTNGDFETGDTSGWTFEMGLSDETNGGYSIKTDSYATNNTTQMLNVWTNISVNFSMKQVISDVPEGTYRFIFDQEGAEKTSGLSVGINDISFALSATTGWDNWVTVTTDEFTLTEVGTVTITISGTIAADYWGDFDNFILQKYDEGAGETDSGEESGSQIKITASSTTVEPGETVTLTADVRYNGTEYADLDTSVYQIGWWVDSWNDHADGLSDAVISDSSSLTTTVTLPSEGTYYIVCDLYDITNSSSWTTLLSSCVTLTAVSAENDDAVEGDLNITKVSDLSDDFIMGMDISSIISEFASNVKYKDYDGNVIDNVTDFCKFLAENGITHIRVRVWNDPYDSDGNGYGGGNNDVEKATTIADACREAGIKLLVDFHCSDLWTDPSKQQAPKAWKNFTVEEKAEALKTFLTDSLNTIDPNKDTVTMVQVGNETTTGFIGETDTTNMCKLFAAGAESVREYNEDVKIVIHETNPEASNMTTWAKTLYENNVDYDILATSYYPYWHGTLANLKSQLSTVKTTYNKDVMVVETSYAYTLEDSDGHDNTVREGTNDSGENTTEPFTVQGQATSIRNLIAAVNEAGGLGVFYWEPAWITVGDTTGLTGDAYDEQVAANQAKWEEFGSGWASRYASEYDPDDAGKWYGGSAVDNEAMFYPNGTPTAGLHVWNYVKTGAVSNEVGIDSLGTKAQLNVTIKVGESHSLPETITVAYTNGSVEELVAWNTSDVSAMTAAVTGTYTVSGTVTFSKVITQGIYAGRTSARVVYTLTVLPANLITNADDAEFNSGDNFTAEGAALKSIPSTENPYSGSYCMSWWSTEATTATVTYNTELTLEKGSYVFEAVSQGLEREKVTLQILDTDENVLYEGDGTELAGWQDWQTPSVAFSLSAQTTVKLRISLEIAAGGWGSVDCLYLYSTTTASSGSSSGSSGSGSSASSGASSSTDSAASDTAVTVIENEDGTTTEIATETVTNEAGNEVELTVTTEKDADGNVTGRVKVSVIENAAGHTSVVVTVAEDAQGEVRDAVADLTTVRTDKDKGVVGTIDGGVIAQITEAAGVDAVDVTVNVTGVKGKTKYTVRVNSAQLTEGNELKIVAIDEATGEYILVNANTYTVSEDGSIEVSLHSGKDYELVTTEQASEIETAVLKTVKLKKSSATVKAGKTTTVQMSTKLNMDNVKKITYTTSKKSVAAVNKNGKVTTKTAGTVTIKSKVTLNNGTTKTVTMKIKVK